MRHHTIRTEAAEAGSPPWSSLSEVARLPLAFLFAVGRVLRHRITGVLSSTFMPKAAGNQH